LIEMMYEQAGELKVSEVENYAYSMRAESSIIYSIINDFELFITDGDVFYSESVKRRLALREAKSSVARKSAESRWNKTNNANASKSDANASKSDAFASKSDAIKESKENKKIGEDNKLEIASPSKVLILSFLKENTVNQLWTESYREKKAEYFEGWFKNNWKPQMDWKTKLSMFILTEKDAEVELGPDKISDGRNIPHEANNAFYKSCKTVEDKKKVSLKWKNNGFHHQITGKDSEIGWHKVSVAPSGHKGPRIA